MCYTFKQNACCLAILTKSSTDFYFRQIRFPYLSLQAIDRGAMAWHGVGLAIVRSAAFTDYISSKTQLQRALDVDIVLVSTEYGLDLQLKVKATVL